MGIRKVRGRLGGNIALLVVVSILGPRLAHGEPAFAPGGSLQEALIALQERGLKVVYSSRVVGPELEVRSRVPSGESRRMLESLLAPHGLVAKQAPIGWFVITRAKSPADASTGFSSESEYKPNQAQARVPLLRVEEQLTVNPLVWIPVQVLRDAKPARGLAADDFEVFLRKKKVPLAGFRVLDHTRDATPELIGGSAARSPIQGRHFVLFFDLIDATSLALRQAKQAASGFLDSSFEPGDLGMVASYSPIQGFRLRQEFTPDLGRLRGAIHLATRGPPEPAVFQEAGQTGAGSGNGPDQQFVADAVVPNLEKQTSEAVVLSSADSTSEALNGPGASTQQDPQGDLQQTVGLLDWIETVGSAASVVPGSAHLLIFSAGLDVASIAGLAGETGLERARIEQMNRAAGEGRLWSVDSDLRYGSSWALRRYRQCVHKLAELGCRVHGLRTGFRPSTHGAEVARMNGLSWMAKQTGGTFSTDATQFNANLAGALAQTAVSYLLGIEVDPNVPSESGPVRVTLAESRENDLVSYPPDLPRAREEGLMGAERTLVAMNLLTSRTDRSAFASHARVLTADSPDSARHRLQLFLDSTSLVSAAAPKPVLTLDVWAYAASSTGEWTQLARKRFSLDLEKLTPRDLGDVVMIEEFFELPPGEYLVRTLVQNVDNGSMSLRSTDVRISSQLSRLILED